MRLRDSGIWSLGASSSHLPTFSHLEPSAPGSVGLEFGRRRRKRLPENFLKDLEEPGTPCKIPSDGPAIHKVPSCHVSSIFCTDNAGASVKSVILLSLL